MKNKKNKQDKIEKVLSTKQIYNILCEISKLEGQLKNESTEKQKAYLIDKESFDSLKIHIQYQSLQKYTDKTIYNYNKCQKAINNTITEEDIKNIKELNDKIVYYSFNNSKDLLTELLDNQAKFYLMDKNIGDKIFILKKNNETNQILYYKINNKKIELYFKEKDILNFKINKRIIEKGNLIMNNNQELEKKNESINETQNKNELGLKGLIEEFKKNYKYQLQISIEIFSNYNEIKNKKNHSFTELNKDKENIIFLINNNWIEKFKMFYEYEDIESHLLNINEFESENIIENLPNEYFNKMIQKLISNNNKVNKIEEISMEECKIRIEKKNIDLKYFNNFQIINSKISGLLTIAGYNYEQIKADLYYIGNNKILLRFNDKITINNSFCDEIGIINETKIFIPQNILFYLGKIDDFFLKKFLKENIKTISEQCDLPLKIKDNNDSIVGYCFSIKYIDLIKSKEEEEIKENQNLIEQDSIDDIQLNNDIKNPKKISVNINDELNSKVSSNVNQKINVYEQMVQNLKINTGDNDNDVKNENQTSVLEGKNMKEEINEDNNGEINNMVESIMEIILLMNKFEKEIDKKLNFSSNSKENKIEECLLIKQEWLEKFKKTYINEEIEECITNLVSEDVNSNIKILFSGIKNKKDYFNKINEAELSLAPYDIIYFNTSNLAKLLKNNDIFYPKDFYIINQNIFEKLLNFYQIDETDELNKNKINMVKYIINNGKIIFSYEYFLNQNDNDIIYYNILICEKDENNIKIIKPIIIQCFEDKKDKRDEQFNEYIMNKFSSEKEVGNNDNDIVVKRPLKQEENEETIFNLFNLYIGIQRLRKKINEEIKLYLEQTEEKDYYIVNKNWMNDFTQFFGFKNLSSLISKHKNKKQNELLFFINNDKTINDIIKQKDNFKNTKYCFTEEKTFQNGSINYYNNFELINDEIKHLIENFINIKFEIKGKFLFVDNRAFVFFNNQNYLLIGKFNEEKSFIANILMQFKDFKYIDLYIKKFKTTKFEDIIQDFKYLKKNSFDNLPGNIGNIYIINKDIEFEVRENIKSLKNEIQKKFLDKSNKIINVNNLFKNSKDQKFFLVNQKRAKSKINKKIKEVFNKLERQRENNEDEQQIKSNKNSIQLEEEEKEADENDIIKEIKNQEEENIENVKEEEFKKLDPFEERQIKALIKYYYFIHDLENNIDLSDIKDQKFNQYDCYLINYNWMQTYKNFYLYDDLIKIIKQKDINVNSDKKTKEQFIFENLSQDYIKNIIKKRDSYDEIFENTQKIEFSLKKYEINQQCIIYPKGYEILNSEVYNLLQPRKSTMLDQKKKSCIVNSKKIIIQYQKKNLFELLIGNYNFDKNKFILEVLLKYDKEDVFNLHYNSLKFKGLKTFLKEKIINFCIIEDSHKVGEIVLLNSGTKNEIIDVINQNQIEQEIMINKIKNKNNIKFLFDLHYFLNILKFEININI